MVGRELQIQQLKKALNKNKSSFIAVTGRRRVGKTFLIDTFFKKHICFRLTGIQDARFEVQLQNFSIKLKEYYKKDNLLYVNDWQNAFQLLKEYLQTLDKQSKKVIFIDELPWIATSKSGFLKLLSHLWNDYLSKEKHFILVVCGSSTSWITQKIVNDKGGLHNRISDIIYLQPLTLLETKDFLLSLNISLTHQEISKLYMAFGGIPYYLEQINKGESSAVSIERLCFSDDGLLKNEYNNLYKALFKNAQNHETIITALATSRTGLSRIEILTKSKLKSGGQYNRTMDELMQSGFVAEFIPYGRKKRGVLYRLNDEYSIFYHRFIKPNKKYVKGIWSQLSASQSYKIWLGYTFETLCFKHISQIKNALGISGVYTEISSLRVEGNDLQDGFQIDLIIDRKDDVTNLCEIKYYSGNFTIDKSYAKHLINRKQRFIDVTKTKKQVFTTFITNYELKENAYALETIDNSINLDSFFK